VSFVVLVLGFFLMDISRIYAFKTLQKSQKND